jgi:cytochrome c oxidase subunit 2
MTQLAMTQLPFFPDEASTEAARTDFIYFGLTGFSLVVTVTVIGLLIVFAIRYRRGSAAPRGNLPEWVTRDFEIGWTSAAFFLFLFAAFWTGATRLAVLTPPSDAMEIHIVAKQWMWKTQHANGAREINALHVPVGEPVRLAMTSEDVIHSFFVPEFRIKQDVLPGRYTRAWFNATKVGVYHLLCTQLCGTEHARMTGEVVVMSQPDFAKWLAAQPHADNLVAEGQGLFATLGCSGCHGGASKVSAPRLDGLYGQPVDLADGGHRLLDDAFIRDIVLQPTTHAVRGYEAIMPSYTGLVGDDDLLRLAAYIRSLGRSEEGAHG